MYLMCKVLLTMLISQVHSSPRKKSYSEIKSCNIGNLVEEIASYDSLVRDIMDYVVTGPFKRKTYDEYSNKMDSTLITTLQYLWGSGEMYSVGCFLILFIITISEPKSLPKTSDKCRALLGDDLINEISSYQNIKEDIFNYVLEGEFKSKTYDELEKFVDKFGSRMSGSQVLEDSIDYMIKLTQDEDLNDIVTEELEVPHWVREQEKITMLEPRSKNIAVLGLGRSISTPPEGVTSDVVVFSSFEEFDNAPIEDVEGKIVLFNAIYTTYGETASYRTQGAARAAEKGAVASLVRSITPFSINSPHTGSQYYSENVTKIPTAAITLEDADLINRFYNRGEKVVLNIKMQSSFETKTSRNTLIDLKGTKNPEKLVIVSGHIDSWDVGQGAMDDGGGLFVSWAAPIILKRLNLRPKRTVRAIFWTAEELGLIGASAYAEKHKNESHNINFIMESDEGTFAPRGLSMAGTQEARCIIAEILKLFESINASTLVETDSPGSDITVIVQEGVPGASLHNANENYFWFHHTEGDTMNVENPEELDLCTAFWTAVAYIIADISVDIPR